MSGKITSGAIWKLLERFGVFGVQFLIQIVLARKLDPSYYGMLTMMTVFTTIANIFVQTGFNTSLVQNKDVTEKDYSSVFWVSLLIAFGLYGIIFVSAPFIAHFYKMPQIVLPLRILALILIPGAFNSIQVAKATKEMNFKKIFFGNVWGVTISGVIGIFCAYNGFGLWSLVIQNLLNITISSLVMLFTVKWFPRLVLNLSRVKVLFSFGWKILVSALFNTLYSDLSSLLIGKKYNAATLGFYNRGMQFSQITINPIDSVMQSVLLPAMSKEQDNREYVKAIVKKAIILCSYIVFPILAGLAAVATPLIAVILKEKWLACVPYLQLFCIAYSFWPICTANIQVFNSIGRSDLSLKRGVIAKLIEIFFLIICIVFFKSPISIAVVGIITVPSAFLLNSVPNKKLINYSALEQFKDFSPSLICAVVMFISVYSIQFLGLSYFVTLILQVFVGVTVYLLLSVIFKLKGFILLKDIAFKALKKE